jgi:hypothetical protein
MKTARVRKFSAAPRPGKNFLLSAQHVAVLGVKVKKRKKRQRLHWVSGVKGVNLPLIPATEADNVIDRTKKQGWL